MSRSVIASALISGARSYDATFGDGTIARSSRGNDSSCVPLKESDVRVLFRFGDVKLRKSASEITSAKLFSITSGEWQSQQADPFHIQSWW